jgi:long-chain fatty acid transport protein
LSWRKPGAHEKNHTLVTFMHTGNLAVMKKLVHALAASRYCPVASRCCLYAALAILPVCSAHAGGFALNESSASSLGTAHAGAGAEDAGTIFYNPAALTRLRGSQFMAAGSLLMPSIHFHNQGSATATGAPLAGGNGGGAGSTSFVPGLFTAHRVSPDLTFGLGIHAPFGLKTNYDWGWAGRYQALKSELIAIDINPTLAYRIDDRLSVGAGLSAQYVNVEISKAIDFGSICAGSLGLAACAPAGYLPQARDGAATVKGHDWGFGFNLGLMLQPNAVTRLGIAFRSAVKYTIDGDARYARPQNLPAPLALAPAFTNSGASARLELPESLRIGAQVDLSPRWTLMGDATWMRWNRFQELRISFANGAPDSVTPENWRNTVRVAVGAAYRASPAWKLRGGIAWDPTPVRQEFITPRIPDADRTWLAFGAQYQSSAQSTWEVGYAHLFIKDASIDKREPPAGGRLVGRYGVDADILSVQYTRGF